MADERRMPTPEPVNPPGTDTLLAQTLETYASRVAPPADSLARMQTRLAQMAPTPRPWAGHFRWVVAGAVALLLLIVVLPIGRATAANVGHAARSAIVTMRDAVTGGGDDQPTPARPTSSTSASPVSTGVSGSATVGSGSATAGSGSAVPAVGTVTGTARATAGSTPSAATPSPTNTPASTVTGAATPTGSPAVAAPLLPTAAPPATIGSGSQPSGPPRP